MFRLAKETLITHVSLGTLHRWVHEFPTEAYDTLQSERRLDKTTLAAVNK